MTWFAVWTGWEGTKEVRWVHCSSPGEGAVVGRDWKGGVRLEEAVGKVVWRENK